MKVELLYVGINKLPLQKSVILYKKTTSKMINILSRHNTNIKRIVKVYQLPKI